MGERFKIHNVVYNAHSIAFQLLNYFKHKNNKKKKLQQMIIP